MKAKGIFIKTISIFFIVYLILMIIFSNHIINEEKEKNRISFLNNAFKVSDNIWDTIEKYSDDNGSFTDIKSANNEFVNQYFANTAMEMAVFNSDFELIYNTSDNWLISYSENNPIKNIHTQFGHLNPEDWFTEEEVKKIEDKLYAYPKVKEEGDVSAYYVKLKGFWVDGINIIPDTAAVMEERATRIDESGNVLTIDITEIEEYVFKTNYQDTEDLPYYTSGSVEKHPGIAYIDPEKIILRKDENQRKIREKVLDVEALKESIKPELIEVGSYEDVEGFKQQSYIVIANDSSYLLNADERKGVSYYAVFANESSALQNSTNVLIPIWISSFVIFMLSAVILSFSNYKTYKKKEALDKQHRELTNALAHDLKTPLAIISGYSENLRENVHSEKREYYAAKIQDKAIYMDGIIKEMLELSRLEAGKVKLNKEELSLSELSYTVYNRYIEVINEKNIHFTIEGDSIILGDRNLILKVIDNFLINAVNFTPENRRIEITISDKAYEIYNSGSYIPKDKINDIWTAYSKGDDARSISQGTGLGLYISGEILTLHNLPYGACNITNGVKFWFLLKGSVRTNY